MGVDFAPFTDVETTGLDKLEIIQYEEPDPRREYKAHIINPPANLHIFTPGMEAQDIVDIARTTGQVVIALCGYKFIPKHNPDKFDACETCLKIAGDIMRELGE